MYQIIILYFKIQTGINQKSNQGVVGQMNKQLIKNSRSNLLPTIVSLPSSSSKWYAAILHPSTTKKLSEIRVTEYFLNLVQMHNTKTEKTVYARQAINPFLFAVVLSQKYKIAMHRLVTPIKVVFILKNWTISSCLKLQKDYLSFFVRGMSIKLYLVAIDFRLKQI